MNAKTIHAAVIFAAATALAAPTQSTDATPSHVCVADKAAPMSSNTNHWWWGAQKKRVDQVKAAKAAGGTVDVFLLGDSILHYWELEENRNCWKRTFSGEPSR